MKKLAALALAAILTLGTVCAWAAADKYVVVKDKNGVCRVMRATGKTPKTIAGPFDTKAEAVSAKERNCPKKGK